jgi:hypothetical protein
MVEDQGENDEETDDLENYEVSENLIKYYKMLSNISRNYKHFPKQCPLLSFWI